MAESRRTKSKAPTERPRVREEAAALSPSAINAALARSLTAMKNKLADAEQALAREKQERAADADTIAEMLLRIVALEKALKSARVRDEKMRSMGPPAAPAGALQRVASLEGRVEEAEARARAAEARTADAEANARAARDRLASLQRDHDALRAAVADADARARSAEDRVAHAEQLAKSAKARALELTDRFESMQTELVSLEARARAAESRAREVTHEVPDDRELSAVRIQLEAAHMARDDARAALAAEKENQQRELERQRERHAVALREAHDAYAEAFNATLEDERNRMREEIEEARGELRTALARIGELEDRLKAAEDRADAGVLRLRQELEAMTFDRDAADRQSELTKIQYRTARTKLELIDKQLELAEEASAIEDVRERIASARGAIAVDDEELLPPSKKPSVRPRGSVRPKR